jgi:hypothetical protein
MDYKRLPFDALVVIITLGSYNTRITYGGKITWPLIVSHSTEHMEFDHDKDTECQNALIGQVREMMGRILTIYFRAMMLSEWRLVCKEFRTVIDTTTPMKNFAKMKVDTQFTLPIEPMPNWEFGLQPVVNISPGNMPCETNLGLIGYQPFECPSQLIRAHLRAWTRRTMLHNETSFPVHKVWEQMQMVFPSSTRADMIAGIRNVAMVNPRIDYLIDKYNGGLVVEWTELRCVLRVDAMVTINKLIVTHFDQARVTA